jgi:hypothetical protein
LAQLLNPHQYLHNPFLFEAKSCLLVLNAH